MENAKKLDINIIAHTCVGEGISGGDRIFIECARRWAKEVNNVNVFVWEEGHEMCKRNILDNVNYVVQPTSRYKKYGLFVLYLARTIKGCIEALKFKSGDNKNMVIYSSSDFWPDSIPGFFMSRKIKGSKWVAAFYLFTPSPFSKESPYKGKTFLKGLLYYLSQRVTYWLIKRYANMVFVTNDLDRERFICHRLPPEKVVAIMGGVDIKMSNSVPTPKHKKYDAVFIGRLVPHKGVLELLDIWSHVCELKKNAKLAILGSGELEKQIRDIIRKHHLESNIDLLGFVDGVEKIEVMKASRIVLHPSIYDSGGMAPCEAMVCGLPGVSFDLPALRTYYPKGMLKTTCFDVKVFCENIMKLLENDDLYKKIQKEAIEWAQGWDWDKRANEILNKIRSE